jgi:flagellar biosynthesis protein FlhF
MQVKKFEAPSMAEAIQLVKTELGPEAIILSTKNNKKGFGLLSKPSVEVTAAISEKSLNKKQVTERLVKPEVKEKLKDMPASRLSKIYNDFGNHYEKRKDEQKNKKFQKDEERSQRNYIDIKDDDDSTALLKEMHASSSASTSDSSYARNGRAQQTSVTPKAARQSNEMNYASGFGGLGNQISEVSESFYSSPTAGERSNSEVIRLQEDVERIKGLLEEIKTDQFLLNDSSIKNLKQQELQKEFQELLLNGIDKKLALRLIQNVQFNVSMEGNVTRDVVLESLAKEMLSGIKTYDPLNVKKGHEKKMIALVGPTGVGKTTTMAKLASQAILQKNLKVGLINIDSYKIAALDQLATYAKILNVPFRQASNAIELERALTEFKPLDLILIDTSGRSQKDSENLVLMKKILGEFTSIESLLILSATTRDQELHDIVRRFEMFSPNGLLFSKLDESNIYGCIYNLAQQTKLPLTYFTVGQRVPEDIELASAERVVDLILDLQ